MTEWEKKNSIDLKAKKAKLKRKGKSRSSKIRANKENQNLMEKEGIESCKNKEKRIQKLANTKISNWIKTGSKNNWLSFKNIR